MRDTYRIAGHEIAIASLYADVHALCRDYRSEGAPECMVETTREDIAFERARSAMEAEREGRVPEAFSDGYLETLAVYRRIAERMLDWDTMLLHGSVVAVDGRGYLFTAKSGTGKSTHARLWRERFGPRATMINDDKPLLRVGDVVTAFGTPWNGKHRLGENASAPLRAICLLERGAENWIEAISVREALPMLVQQSHRPSDPERLIRTLELVERLAGRVRLYRLRCNMDPDAARVAYEGMSEE